MLAGVFAFGAIVWGGFKYIIAGGNPSGQSDAKDQVLQAIIGLLLLVGSGLILRTIDPNLLHIELGKTGVLEAPKPACTPACTGGATCVVLPGGAVGTCKVCGLDCGKAGVCMFNEGGSPYCLECPSDTAQLCYSQNKVCKASGGSFACATVACGDGGENGPCPAGCTCLHDPNNTSKPYACVKQNSTDKCPTTIPRPAPPTPPSPTACATCTWHVPDTSYGCVDQNETTASGGCGSTPQYATNECRPKYVKTCH
jgi:hypothetical protein